MPKFRIHRMKDGPRQNWATLRESEQALGVGDLLETESGQLRICKYVGFEVASWLVADLPIIDIPVTDMQPSAVGA